MVHTSDPLRPGVSRRGFGKHGFSCLAAQTQRIKLNRLDLDAFSRIPACPNDGFFVLLLSCMADFGFEFASFRALSNSAFDSVLRRADDGAELCVPSCHVLRLCLPTYRAFGKLGRGTPTSTSFSHQRSLFTPVWH
ncbi:unnamed protein product [Protopolystoma xenopodis]|uniref:Uncharacterized protein n=1 Tax=Protopolystoma xenopodis TaxID=117903 RepID=A0A3S4ZTP7_9PLAT|nr:unnamed protein product [Protopolystoma xenopodis]